MTPESSSPNELALASKERDHQMSVTNDIDPAAELADIHARGADHLERLRKEHAERRAELDRIDREEAARLAAAEAAFAADVEQRQRAIQIAQAHETYTDLQTNYTATAKTADKAVAALDAAITAVADAYRDAVTAELSRVECGEAFRASVYRQLAKVDPDLAMPNIPAKRLIVHDRNHPLASAQQIAVNVDRSVERTVRQLQHHAAKRFGDYYMSGGERVEIV